MNNNKMRHLLFIALLLTLSLISTVNYAVPNPSHEFYVYDEADLIDNNLKQYIINTNKNLYDKTGAQVVVATLNSLENIDINMYAVELFEEWKIGSRKEDNGILILIVPEQGQLWIETGYGSEGIFPASKTKRIIEDQMIPYFQEDRYSDGILAGFNKIIEGFEGEYNLNIEGRQEIENPISSANNSDGFSIPRIFMVIGIILLLIMDFRFFGGILTYSLLRGFGRGGGRGGGSGGSSGGGGRSGGGGAGGSW